MRTIRVVVSGAGGVGSNVIRLLAAKEGVEIVGVLDIDPAKVGKDAGTVAGIGELGIPVTADQDAVYQNGADVVICTSSPTSQTATFEQMLPAIQRGINVIAANMGTCNLWVSDPALAERIDRKCRAHGVSYFGIGATQLQDRFILLQTEGCSKIKKITFTHFADIHAFRPESFRVEWGITLTEEEFYQGLRDGSIERHDYFADGIAYIAQRLGWVVDRVTSFQEPMVDAEKMVYGTRFRFIGYQGAEEKIETNWIFLLDEERRYYDRVVIEGTPYIDSVNNYSPDRGMVSTFAALVNAVPFAVKAAPGYVNTLDIPACTIIEDAYGGHI